MADEAPTTFEKSPMPSPWHYLRDLLVETRRIESIAGYDKSLLPIMSTDVLARIQRGDATWEAMVPPSVAATIKAKHLFGLTSAG